MFKALVISFVVSLVFGISSYAAMDNCKKECSSCHSLTVKDATALLGKIDVNVKSVKQSPARGFFELLVEKNSKEGIVFVDYSKKNLIQGFMVDLRTLQPVAAHTQDLSQMKKRSSIDLKTIPMESRIMMGNPSGAKNIYVFTDPDCPYCRKFHEELKKLEKIAPDVSINIMLYPLPMHPAAYDKARVILSRMDRSLLDEAFAGKKMPLAEGDAGRDKVDAVIRFASANGISGTPTFVLPNGEIVEGLRDAETMKKMLVQ